MVQFNQKYHADDITSSNSFKQLKMKFFLFALFLAIGASCISAHHHVQNFGDTSGTPARTHRLQAPAVPNQVQTRWVQFQAQAPFRGLRHVNVLNTQSTGAITGGGIGQNRLNLTVTSSLGGGIDSRVLFF